MHMLSHRSQIVFRILKGVGGKVYFLLFKLFSAEKVKKWNSSLQSEAIFYFFTLFSWCCVFFVDPDSMFRILVLIQPFW